MTESRGRARSIGAPYAMRASGARSSGVARSTIADVDHRAEGACRFASRQLTELDHFDPARVGRLRGARATPNGRSGAAQASLRPSLCPALATSGGRPGACVTFPHCQPLVSGRCVEAGSGRFRRFKSGGGWGGLVWAQGLSGGLWMTENDPGVAQNELPKPGRGGGRPTVGL